MSEFRKLQDFNQDFVIYYKLKHSSLITTITVPFAQLERYFSYQEIIILATYRTLTTISTPHFCEKSKLQLPSIFH